MESNRTGLCARSCERFVAAEVVSRSSQCCHVFSEGIGCGFPVWKIVYAASCSGRAKRLRKELETDLARGPGSESFRNSTAPANGSSFHACAYDTDAR